MKIFRHLYIQVLVAVFLGALYGNFVPQYYPSPRWHPEIFQAFANGFVNLVKMLIGPIIFSTIVVGIGNMSDLKKVGRVGWKALLYFEVLTTIALVIGLVVVNLVQPGAGRHVAIASLDASKVAAYAKPMTTIGFVMNIIPTTFVSALTSGEILQVLCIAVLFGIAMSHLGEKGRPVIELLEIVIKALMGIVAMVMKLAPIAAFGAIAFLVGTQGIRSLVPLAKLMGCVYATMAVFVFLVLGSILRFFSGLSFWRFLRYIREELLLVLGTSSSESALPGMIVKMENLGCAKPVVGLVLPAGYSFNLDGTCIYLTMAAIFIAQATDTPLDLWQQLGVLAILLLTSKGAAAVTGGGFITLSATLSSTPVPVAGLSLVIGIDRFMSEARAITNLIGNGVATIVVAHWEGELDVERAKRVLAGEPLEIESPTVNDVV
ncbi:MAG TPA: C4-dicarboxylate transporter DctA [Opitutaceae bacterium]|nr:C4-dicarboxylate transporter DctA [Opitutaceae bacterium]